MQNRAKPRGCWSLTADNGQLFTPVLLPDLDIQPLDFLVQGRERNAELFGGFGLVPAALFEHVDDDTALAVFHDLEERRVGTMLHEREFGSAAYHLIGQ